jgi:hypothetical protein
MTPDSDEQKNDAALPAAISPTALSVAALAANSSLEILAKDIAPQIASSAKSLATNSSTELLSKAIESRTAFSAASIAANSSLKALSVESSAVRLAKEFASGNSLLKAATANQSLLDSVFKAADPMRGFRDQFKSSLALEQISTIQSSFRRFEEAFKRPLFEVAAIHSLSMISRSVELNAIKIPLSDAIRFTEQPSWISELQKSAEAYEQRFRLPAAAQISTLFADHHAAFAAIGERHRESMAAMQRSISSMNARWLDNMRAFESTTALAALHGIGNSIERLHPFASEVSAALRVGLGNWRDNLILPDDIAEDINLRTNFYVERGYDPDLTNFPEAAFREGLGLSNLGTELPSLVEDYGLPVSLDESEDEIDFERVNQAHDWLFRFETRFRQFIDTVMTAAIGEQWPKQRVPLSIYENWQEKKQKAEKNPDAAKLPLIAYADFTDYIQVISRKDNWPLFAPTFQRLEDVRESMQRLYPIRLCTMHARFISKDDELLLYVEVKRLIRATSRKNS